MTQRKASIYFNDQRIGDISADLFEQILVLPTTIRPLPVAESAEWTVKIEGEFVPEQREKIENRIKIVEACVKHWRIAEPNGYINSPHIETLLENGEWVFPDCSYDCICCDICLGCQRKQMIDGQGRFAIESLLCPQSPTGYHVATERDEESD